MPYANIAIVIVAMVVKLNGNIKFVLVYLRSFKNARKKLTFRRSRCMGIRLITTKTKAALQSVVHVK